jgi:hypothetical protein
MKSKLQNIKNNQKKRNNNILKLRHEEGKEKPMLVCSVVVFLLLHPALAFSSYF